jgi:single-strand selective monofunctional uracil DNA glycosylase
VRPLTVARRLEAAAALLRDEAANLTFGPPVFCVYNPLEYAWDLHRAYVQLCGHAQGGVLFLGMNPGPFGMVQTGVPFGEVAAVRDWMGLCGEVHPPRQHHPKRPVAGFACPRSEVSGRRLWGLMASRWPNARDFFDGHAILNYCPLAFVSGTAANITPDKLSASERDALFGLCNRHLAGAMEALQPRACVGVGRFATARFRTLGIEAVEILHPSPASPAANRGWAQVVTTQLEQAGIW